MQKNLTDILRRLEGKKMVVWGDLILDEYVYTTTGRISREAPVLVTEFESNEYILGGAGNVVMNIKALGAIPVPVAFVGTNDDGITLKRILEENGVTTDYLVELENYLTPKKSRILSGGDNTKKQQVLRIDTLNKADVDDAAFQRLEAMLMELSADIDFMIISDYIYKSVRSDVFNRVREAFPANSVIIDSRRHLTKFKGVTVATPNEPEVKAIFPGKHFLDEQDYYDAGAALLERLDARGVILKRGHEGMIVFEKGRPPVPIEIYGSADIVDVTGAGDTVISVAGPALAAGAELTAASQLANIAAGIVVMKEGCYPITKDELEYELNQILPPG